MSFKVYLGRNINDTPEGYHTSHEMFGVRQIATHLQEKYHGNAVTDVALVANPRLIAPGESTDLDLVIISEAGIGFVEMKSHTGKITYENLYGPWKANGGVFGRGNHYMNPYEQINFHVEHAMKLILNSASTWFPGLDLATGRGDNKRVNQIGISTAVCFTHPLVNLSGLDKGPILTPERSYREVFSVVTPGEMVGWVNDLQFGLHKGDHYIKPYSLVPGEIINLAVNLFNAVEWEEMNRIVREGGDPFGLFVLVETGQPIRIDHMDALIGRSPTAHIMLPQKYRLTSNQHARITHFEGQAYLETLGRNGTFIDGIMLEEKQQIQSGQLISFGPLDHRESCLVKYLSQEQYETIRTRSVFTR